MSRLCLLLCVWTSLAGPLLSQGFGYSYLQRKQINIYNDIPVSILSKHHEMVDRPNCQIMLTESMPENLTYSPGSPKHPSTTFAWNVLIDQASRNLTIASFYWSLLAEPQFNASAVEQGREIFNSLLTKACELQLTVEQSGAQKPNVELDQMIAAGAKVYWVDVPKLLGTGIIHTKLWTADRKHAYVGSANMDWRSLTQVKELGVLVLNCPLLVEDLDKIHGAYQLVSTGIPNIWPQALATRYNMANPMRISVNGVPSHIYISGSPSAFNAPGRTNDLDAILSVINKASRFIHISVMDYNAEVVSYKANSPVRYWPVIDDALRTAALDRGVEVRLLISHWQYSSAAIPKHLDSLRSLNGIHGSRIRVRYFVVPIYTDDQRIIPHARVNHNKYMVTDKTAYIGTSNWSGDYFLFAGGVGFVYEEDFAANQTSGHSSKSKPQSETLRTQLVDIFSRDWNSEYAFEDWD